MGPQTIDYAYQTEGPKFEGAIRKLLPRAVHVHSVFAEHGNPVAYSFADAQGNVHSYCEDLAEWCRPTLTLQKLERFVAEYGTRLVHGSVEQRGDDRYHFFRLGALFAPKIASLDAEVTYQGWQRGVKEQFGLSGKVLTIQKDSRAVVDAMTSRSNPYVTDHYVLDFTPSERWDLQEIVRENLRDYKRFDVNPYLKWAEEVRLVKTG